MLLSEIRPALGMLAMVTVLTACGADSSDAPTQAASTEAMSTVLSIGSLGLDPADNQPVFSIIFDVQSGPKGSFVVLDNLPSVRWFARDGAYQGAVASSGQGPGELRDPRSVFFLTEDLLGIGDPANNRTSFYRMTPDSVYYERSFPWTPTHPAGEGVLCSIQGRLFARDLRDGHVIHELTDQGQIVNSFQRPDSRPVEEFGPAADMATRLFNSGRLICIEHPSLLLSMNRLLPYVSAYTPDGELVWETEVADFRLYGIEPLSQGGMMYEPDPEGSHIGLSAVRWGDDSILLQYSIHPTIAPPEDRDFHAIDSRILSLSTGVEMGRSDTLPRITDVGEGGVYYSFDNLPFPRVHVVAKEE